jgi:hypothetical protein
MLENAAYTLESSSFEHAVRLYALATADRQMKWPQSDSARSYFSQTLHSSIKLQD